MEDNNINEMSIINPDNFDDSINSIPLNINNNVKREIDIDFEDERFDIKDENYHSKCGEIFVSKDKEFTFYCSICNENFLNFNFFSEHVLYDQNHENQLVFINNFSNGNNTSSFVTSSLPLSSSSSIILANNPFTDYSNCDNIVKSELLVDDKDELSDEKSPPNIFVDDVLEVISEPPAEFYHNTGFNEQNHFSELTEEPIILANLREEILQDELSNTSQGSNNYPGFHKCNFCKKDFSRAWNLNIHLKRCKLNVEKIDYHQAYKSDSAIKIMCPICKMSFQREINLNFHLKKYHKNTVWAHTDENLLRCDLCNTSFKRREYLRKHIKRHMAKHRKQQVLPNPIASDYKLECQSCNMKFDEEYQLFAHKSTHLYTESSHIKEWDTKYSLDLKSSTSNKTVKVPFEFVDDSTFNQINKQFKCHNCDRSFENEESHKMHYCVNIFDRPHQCLTCNRSFMYQSYLKRHMKRCTMRKFINENDNNDDHYSLTKYKDKCTDYKDNFFPSIPLIEKTTDMSNTPTKSTISSPFKRKASGNLLLKLFKCKFCKKVFRSKINLQTHLSIHLKSQNKSITENIRALNKIQSIPPPLKCKMCGRRFKQKISLIIHERAHYNHKPYECNLCHLKFYNHGYLYFHQRSIHKIYTINKSFNCNICNRKFLTKSILNNHLNKKHENEETITSSVKLKNLYLEEIKKFDNNISLPSEQIMQIKNLSERTKYKCRFCPKLINRRTNLIIHERIHLGQRPHSCDICKKTFPSISYVKLHKKNAHNITVPRIQYQCEYCPKITTTEYFLTLHINNSHREQCPHECNNCLKRFSTVDHLTVHSKTEHARINNSDNIVPEEVSLIEISEAENTDNIYDCNVCSKTFSNLYKLNIHQREHNTVSKLYYCNLCDKSFSCAPYLWKHNQFWHKESTSNLTKILPNLNTESVYSEKEDDITTSNVKLKNQKEDYYLYVHSCDICGKKFKKIAYLKMHFAKHTDTYKCEICGKRCSSSHNLNVHQQIHVNDSKIDPSNTKTDKNESVSAIKIENSDNLSKAVNSCIKNKMSIIGASKFYNLDFRMLYKNVAIKRRELNDKLNSKTQGILNFDNPQKKPNIGISQSNKLLINRKRIYKKRASAALENSKFRQEGTKEREALIKAVRLYEAGELSQAQVAKSFNISVASLCRHMSTVPRSGETEVILSNDVSNSIVEINNEKSIKIPTDLSTWYTENSSNTENDDIDEMSEVIKAEECFNSFNKSKNVDFQEIRKILSQPAKSLSTIKVVDTNKIKEDILFDFQNLAEYSKTRNDAEMNEYKLDSQQNSVRRHPIEKILTAVEEYKKGGVSQSKICETYKISLSTLKRHLKKSKRLELIRIHKSDNQNNNEINPSAKIESSNNFIKAVNSCIKNKMSIIGASKFYNLDFKMLYKNVVIKRRELVEKANQNLLTVKDDSVLNFEQKLYDNKHSNMKSSSNLSNTQSAIRLLYNRNKKKLQKRVPFALGNSKFRQEGTAERVALLKAVRLYRSGEMSQVKAAKYCNISLATLCRHMNSVPKGDETKGNELEANRNSFPLNIEKDYNRSNTYKSCNYSTKNVDNIPEKVSDNIEEHLGNSNKTSNFNIDDILNRSYTTTTEYDKEDKQFDSFSTSHEFAEHSAFFSSDDQLSKSDKADLQRCSIEKIAKAIEEYKKGGVSQSKICKMYRMSLSTLQRYLKDEQKPIISNYKPIPTTSSTISPINNNEKNFNDDNLLKAIFAVRNEGLSHLDAANAHNVSVSALYLSLKRNEDNQ